MFPTLVYTCGVTLFMPFALFRRTSPDFHPLARQPFLSESERRGRLSGVLLPGPCKECFSISQEFGHHLNSETYPRRKDKSELHIRKSDEFTRSVPWTGSGGDIDKGDPSPFQEDDVVSLHTRPGTGTQWRPSLDDRYPWLWVVTSTQATRKDHTHFTSSGPN